MFYLLPLTLIFWPFNIGFINSQVWGVVLILFLTLYQLKFNKPIKIKIPWIPFLFYFLFFIFLLVSIVTSDGSSEIFKFLFYILMIPFLFVSSFCYFELLEIGKNDDLEKIFYTVIPFLVFCIIELLSPAFHDFVAPYVASESAQQVVGDNFSGNAFRNLGWTGFLFADYSVAFAFTALGVMIFGKKVNIFSLSIEFFCILLALIAGRSALPIVFIYVLISLTYALNVFRVASIIIITSTMVIYLLSTLGGDFFIWMLEPIYRYIEDGDFSSGSVNETNDQFKNFIDSLSSFNLIGDGVYFSSNFSYYVKGLAAGDSGIIRVYHAAGGGGVFLFLMFWISLFFNIIFYYLRSAKKNRELLFFFSLFLIYGIVFFYKSEWLYQKFFIFITFYLFHKISYKK